MNFPLIRSLSLTALGLLLCAANTSARGTGLSRVPSSTAQYFGVCVGPGHHAPIIRSPGYRPPHVQRLLLVPARQGPYGGYASTAVVETRSEYWNPELLTLPGSGYTSAPYPQHQMQMPMQMQPPMPAHPTPGQPALRPTLAPTLAAPQSFDPRQDKPSPAPPEFDAPKAKKSAGNEWGSRGIEPEAEQLPRPAPTPADEDDLLDDDLIDDHDDLLDDTDMPTADPLPSPQGNRSAGRSIRVWRAM